MALNWKIYESAPFETLGALAGLLGAKTKVRLGAKSFNVGNNGYISVVAKKPDGTSARVLCSSGVSKSIRNAHEAGISDNEILKALVKLEVSELEMKDKNTGEVGIVHWLVAPAGEFAELEMWSVESLSKGKAVTYEELVAF